MFLNFGKLLVSIYILALATLAAVNADDCVAQFFKVTSYYSPLTGQDYYAQNTYQDEIKLNGKGTHGAGGKRVFDGMIAAPSKYAFGTKIIIPGLGVGIVEDRGGAIIAGSGGDRIDIWAGSGVIGLQRAYGLGPLGITGYICGMDGTGDIGFNRPTYDGNYNDILFWSINQSIGRQDLMVNKLQNLLIKYGYITDNYIRGVFDEDTRIAVCNYQIIKNIYTGINDVCGIWGSKTRSYFKTDLFDLGVKNYVGNKKNILTTKTIANTKTIVTTTAVTKIDLSKNKHTNSNKEIKPQNPKIIKTKTTTIPKTDKSIANNIGKKVNIYFDKPIDIGSKSKKVNSLQDILLSQGIKIKKTGVMDDQTKIGIYQLQLINKLIKTTDNKNLRGYMGPSTRKLLNKLYKG